MPGLKFTALDVGQNQYGDCLFIRTSSGKTILIDGGNPGSFYPDSVSRSVPEQLTSLLGSSTFELDLLVITHAHNDHIGCLPRMVSEGMLKARWVLAADPDLGWSSGPGTDSTVFDAACALLREDADFSQLSLNEIEFLASDALTLKTRYIRMLDQLKNEGATVIRYNGDTSRTTDLLQEFADCQLDILGPTTDQLKVCALAIHQAGRDSLNRAPDTISQDEPSAAALYRLMKSTDAGGASVLGAAINNQSIVLTLTDQAHRILLTGDMQFSVPEVDGLDPFIQEIRQKVQDRAPYSLVKLSHHASYDGFDENCLNELQGTANYVISTGWGSLHHPNPAVLKLLNRHRNRVLWLRTDRNGACSFDFSGEPITCAYERGRKNDATPNQYDDQQTSLTPRAIRCSPYVHSGVHKPPIQQASDSTPVEIITRIPHTNTRVSLKIKIQPGRQSGVAIERNNTGNGQHAGTPATAMPLVHASDWSIGSGRTFPDLLFVTHRPALEARYGSHVAQVIMDKLSQSGGHVIETLEFPQDPLLSAAQVRATLQDTHGIKGVVLIGGYSIVPTLRLDSLPPSVRRQLNAAQSDLDDFIVFNDDRYGCIDTDQIPDVPVSRIPDLDPVESFYKALSARKLNGTVAKGVRNINRKFADDVYTIISGTYPLEVSRDAISQSLPDMQSSWSYYMLHGHWDDGRAYTGEETPNDEPAVTIQNIPPSDGTVVLAGCCWGALITESPAWQNSSLQTRGTDTSIALTYLARGANAFIGCTGAHYSPTVPPYGQFGHPIHSEFWKAIRNGCSPAEALFQAKKNYIAHMAGSSQAAVHKAIEYKILHQFTCLGLGW